MQSRFATIGEKRIATFSELWNLINLKCGTQTKKCGMQTQVPLHNRTNVAGGLPQFANCGAKCAPNKALPPLRQIEFRTV